MFPIKLKTLPALFFILMSISAFAEEKACLIEGEFTLLGETTEVKDCMQNDGISREQFVKSCEGLANVGSSLGMPPSKMTYMQSCPPNPKGVCKNMAGGKLSGYYYKRDKESMAGTKESCLLTGGTWSSK